jgi:hypothetical protein
LTGNCCYQKRPRDSLKRRNGKDPEVFGIARDINQEAAAAFFGLVKEIPKLSDRKIGEDQVKSPVSLKIINRGLIRSIMIPVFNKGQIEQKEINRMSGDLIQSMNGYGSETVTIEPHDLIPHTIFNGKNTGTFKISKKSDAYAYLKDANVYARNKLVEWTDSSCGRKGLEPRIDLYTTTDREAGFVTVRRAVEIMREEDMPIVLEPATVYKVSR